MKAPLILTTILALLLLLVTLTAPTPQDLPETQLSPEQLEHYHFTNH